jgi:xanthine dehydrogenase YagS FAD-binding subunit
MAVIRDVMPAFDLLQPSSAAEAQSLLQENGADAWVMAGGMDSFDWLKDRIKKPSVLVDLSGVDELKGIRVGGDGVEIGAMTTLSDIANHAEIKKNYGVLSQAVEVVASPQIRNQGTLGGNVSQDVRCWYYRGGWPCYRAGGDTCYADTPVGRNREHAIFGANRCVAVHPSDSVPALIALDAKFVLETPKGQRIVDAEDYFVGPETDITRINMLQPGDLLTAIRIPATWAGANFYFEKVRDRNVWDFPLMNVASAMKVQGGTISDIRIAVNAVSPRPMRLKKVEGAVRGKAANAETGEMAGKMAVQGAVPLQFNSYKIPLMRNLVKRAVSGVSRQANSEVAESREMQEAAWS